MSIASFGTNASTRTIAAGTAKRFMSPPPV
jgi:hypothetical protein